MHIKAPSLGEPIIRSIEFNQKETPYRLKGGFVLEKREGTGETRVKLFFSINFSKLTPFWRLEKRLRGLEH